jgi:hypothetical protein
MSEVEARRREAGLWLEKLSSYAGGAQRANDEAVMRKELVTGMIFGLALLLAPFIFATLLNWNSHGWSR